jgi:DNA-binding transcriptional LysR family regulator
MDRLAAMETFVHVVTAGSFASAATEMKRSRPSVTKRIAGLEAALNTKLLNRTTRGMSLTDMGERYYAFCVKVLEDMRKEEEEIARLHDEPAGALKVLAAKSFGVLHMGQAVAAFAQQYPNVSVSLTIADVAMKALDPVSHAADVVIRTRPLPDSALYERRIGSASGIVCASPEYLKRHGVPRKLADLANHVCLVNDDIAPDKRWHLYGPAGKTTVKVAGSLTSNSSLVLRHMILSGMGIAVLPTFCVAADIRSAQLVHVLKSYKTREYPILAIFHEKQLRTKKLRLFIDFLAARFLNNPWDKHVN